MKRAIQSAILGFAIGIVATVSASAIHQDAAKATQEHPVAGSQPQPQLPSDEVLEAEWEKIADSHSSNPALSAKLRATLKKFTKENSLDNDQISRLLSDLVMTSVQWDKGGVGPVGRGTYVILDGNRNRLVVGRSPNRQKWLGESSSHPQLVVTDGKRVLTSVTTDDLTKLQILLFAPSEVRVIDLKTNWGARFLREKNN